MWKVKFDGSGIKSRTYKNRYTLIDGVIGILRKECPKANLNWYNENGKIIFVHTHQAGMIGIDLRLAVAELVL